jgi:hypothetical protein
MFYSADVALLAVNAMADPSVTKAGGTVVFTVPHSMLRNFALAYASAVVSGSIRDAVVNVYDAAPGITDGPRTVAYSIESTAGGVELGAVVDGAPLMTAMYAPPPKPMASTLVVSAEVSRMSRLVIKFAEALAAAHTVDSAPGVTASYAPHHGAAVIVASSIAGSVENAVFMQTKAAIALKLLCAATGSLYTVVAVVACLEATRPGSTEDYLLSCKELLEATCGGHRDTHPLDILRAHGFVDLPPGAGVRENIYAIGDAASPAKLGRGADGTRGNSQGSALLVATVNSLFRDGVMQGDGLEAAVATDVMLGIEAALTLVACPHAGTLPGGAMYGEVRGDAEAGGACRAAARSCRYERIAIDSS